MYNFIINSKEKQILGLMRLKKELLFVRKPRTKNRRFLLGLKPLEPIQPLPPLPLLHIRTAQSPPQTRPGAAHTVPT